LSSSSPDAHVILPKETGKATKVNNINPSSWTIYELLMTVVVAIALIILILCCCSCASLSEEEQEMLKKI